MNMIEIKNLCFSYEENQQTINDVSFSIPKGSYTVILGHNGSGKSTIAKLIFGLLEKKSGNIIVNDMELNEDNLYKVRNHIGIVFQNPDNQFIGTTVRDDIAFGLENKCIPQDKMDDIIMEYATKVGMQDFLNHEPTKLSGGQKQRVAIAGILSIAPDIIIFDESTSMLDPKGKVEMNEAIKMINKDKDITIISITHDIEEAIYADQIIVLNNGMIDSVGNADEILTNTSKLERLGLDTPFATKVSKELQAQGIKVKTHINKEELVNELWQLNLKK